MKEQANKSRIARLALYNYGNKTIIAYRLYAFKAPAEK